MVCPQCRSANPEGNRFCDQCGVALEARCAGCGAALRPGARFCGACGTAVGGSAVAPPPDPAPAPAVTAGGTRTQPYTPRHLAEKILKSRSALEGERRQVTVLFADLAGFTTLAEARDPEDVHALIDRCFAAISAEIHRFEGSVNQYTGDGVMALFGAPIAHEDGPRRAVHAALGIQRAIRVLNRELEAQKDVSLQLRIGLNTGPVVVGKIGDDLRMDYTAVGDTTNLAARMQQAARPGSVVIGEATHAAVEGYFETLDLGEVPAKGRAPARAFEVLRARGGRARLDIAAERGLTPLVGRTRELAVLRERFEEAREGRGQVVVIAGDAGLGKSRLLLEFHRALDGDGIDVTWLEGRCISFGQSIAFGPLVDQLRQNFGIEELDGEPEIIAKVEHGMRRLGALDAHIPFIRYLLAVDAGDPTLTRMDAANRRTKIFEAVRALSLRGAARRPLVLVFEDLHWVDATTEDYLKTVLDSVASVPILMVLTHRIGYTPPFGGRSFVTNLTLRNLNPAESLEIAKRVLGIQDVPEQVRAALLDKAEGVPLFVEEVTKALLDLGVLAPSADGYRVVKSLAEVGVPDTMHGIIMARLDRLGDDGKRTVQLASVIGRQFMHRLLERLAGHTGRLDGLLRDLKALEIIYEQGLLQEPAYVFKHAVIQDVAYNSLLRERRRELHRAVGEAIEELYADRLGEHYEELAHHFVNGEAWDKALEYLVRSGDRARAGFANQAALDFYSKALEAARHLSPPPSPLQLAAIHRGRGEVWRMITRYDESIAEYERLLELARAGGDQHMEGEALVELALSHWLTFSTPHVPHAKRYAEEALTMAERTGDEHVLARAMSYLGLVNQIDGELRDGDRKLARSLEISERLGLPQMVAQNLVWLGAHANWRAEFDAAMPFLRRAEEVAASVHDGFNELFAVAFICLPQVALGEFAEARATIERGLRRSRELQNGFIEGRLLNTLGWFHQELGDFRRALELDREAADIGRRIKNPNVEVSSLINIGLDHLNLGEVDRAIALWEETQVRVDKHAFGAHRWRWSNHLATYLAEGLLARGDFGRAGAQADLAVMQARATGARKYEARALAIRGEIALRAKDWPAAHGDLVAALAIARAIPYPALAWQVARLLAQAAAGADRMDEARAAAADARATIEHLAARAPEPALRQTFLAWVRVQATLEEAERLRSG